MKVTTEQDLRAIENASSVRAYCCGRKCEKCTFGIEGIGGYGCSLVEDHPSKWNLPEDKTNQVMYEATKTLYLAAEMIKKHCENIKVCSGCYFYKNGSCSMSYPLEGSPFEWELNGYGE